MLALTLAWPALAEPTSSLPHYARITYRVTYGEGGIVGGRAVQELRHDGSRYSMSSSMETVGIVRLFKEARLINVSTGSIVAGGLRPDEFSITRNNDKTEKAMFDWAANEVRLDNGNQYPLEPGTQDLLSLFGQLAILPLDSAVISI
ncbi:MAG: DUF3108 domain-containing protein, partial [Burkholderiaceae bacterium]|nr:DUF3108 domain-containing protein [Burkholderiaceae bacterium]